MALARSAPPLTAAALKRALGPDHARFSLRVLERCASTNADLLAAPAPSAHDTTIAVCLAHEQTAGRGRRGRTWHAWPGHSLTFSCLFPWSSGAPAASGLTLTAGLALVETLEAFGLVGSALKWPNDVLVEGRKIAGILVEQSGVGSEKQRIVIGIGLNLHLPDTAQDELAAATALDRHLQPMPAPAELVAATLRQLARRCEAYRAHGLTAIHPAWMQRHAFNGRAVRILDEGRTLLEGECVGIDLEGALLVQRANGTRERVFSGELSLRAAS